SANEHTLFVIAKEGRRLRQSTENNRWIATALRFSRWQEWVNLALSLNGSAFLPALAMTYLWNRIIRGLEWFTITLFAALVIDVLWGVISRYVPGIRPSDWTEELAVYLLVWVSLFGAALTYRGYG